MSAQGRFTVRPNPAADARVARDVARIAEVLGRAAPDADALVLVGSFGRGEGSVVHDAAGWRPVNDYDLALVHPDPDRAPDLRPACRALASELGVGHVDVEVIATGALDTLPPSMHAHDLKHGGQVLSGDPRVLDRIPPIDGAQVDLGPARLLLFNRLTCLIECCTATDLSTEPVGEARFRMLYLIGKVTLSCAAAELALVGRYHASYRERAMRFRALGGPAAHITLVEAATRFKLEPDGPLPDPRPLWFAVRDWYLALLFALVERAFGTFANWTEFARAYRGDRLRDALRKVKWWVLDRRKYRDIVEFHRREDIELAEIFLTRAARPDGTFDAADVAHARDLLAPLTRRPLDDWEACRAACVEADYRYLHPV